MGTHRAAALPRVGPKALARRRSAGPTGIGPPRSVQHLLYLQQTAGNRATCASITSADTGVRTVQRDPAPKGSSGDSDQWARFDSIYDAYCGAYSFVAQAQVNAIDSMYTEAKKPTKPGLLEDLLVSFAMMGLGSVVGVIGMKIDMAVERKIMDAWKRGGVHAGAPGKADIFRQVQNEAKVFAKGANDGFKDGIKAFVAPRVRGLLASGKKPVDAFYEGEKSAVVDAAKTAFNLAKSNTALVWSLRKLHPDAPLVLAQGLLDTVNEAFKDAEALQKRETLRHWLLYQAQEELSAGDGQPSTLGTDLSPFIGAGVYAKTPGVLFVDAYVDRGGGNAYTAVAESGRMAGLSTPMLASLGGAIGVLGLPVRYAVSSREELGGLGKPGDHAGSRVAEQAFFVGVNELGQTWVMVRNSWQKEAVRKIGGVDQLLKQLGVQTLAGLKVAADKS